MKRRAFSLSAALGALAICFSGCRLSDPNHTPLSVVPRSLGRQNDVVSALAFAPLGYTLASGGRDGSVLLWSSEDESEPLRLEGHADQINALAFSPDGSTLASGSRDGGLCLWEVDGGTRLWAVATADSLAVYSVAFSRDGTRLAVASAKLTAYEVAFFDPRSGAKQRVLARGETWVPSLACSPLDDRVAVAEGGVGCRVKVIDAATSGESRSLPLDFSEVGWPEVLAYSADGHLLAVGTCFGYVLLYDARSFERLALLERPAIQPVSDLAFSDDGRLLAVGLVECGVVWVWDVAARRCLLRVPLDMGSTVVMDGPTSDRWVTFAPACWRLAVGGSDFAEVKALDLDSFLSVP